MNEKILERVRKLLEKAESTTFGPEAESLIQAAQELMVKYAIAEADLRRDERIHTSFPTQVIIDMPGRAPLIKAKRNLLTSIGRWNNVKVLFMGKTHAVLIGFTEDIEWVNMLYTSLTLQMIRAAAADIDKRGSANATVWRNNFAWGFALRIDQRLAETHRKVETENPTGMALMVRDKSLVVQQEVSKRYPRVRSMAGGKRRQFDGDARRLGGEAANRADLGSTKLANSSHRLGEGS